MITVLAWFAVILLQLYSVGYAFRSGQHDATNGGGSGYVWLAVIFGSAALVCASFVGGAA